MAAPVIPLNAIVFFDALGRPTLEPDALWCALDEQGRAAPRLRRRPDEGPGD